MQDKLKRVEEEGPAGLLPDPVRKLTSDTLSQLPYQKRLREAKTCTADDIREMAGGNVDTLGQLREFVSKRKIAVTGHFPSDSSIKGEAFSILWSS